MIDNYKLACRLPFQILWTLLVVRIWAYGCMEDIFLPAAAGFVDV